MGAGIARQFRDRFGNVSELEGQKRKVGEVAVLPANGSYIYNLVTKEKYYQKPTYKALRMSLESMRSHCIEHNIRSVTMPQIGCGCDMLDWSHVSDIIKQVFRNTDITIKVVFYDGSRSYDFLL